MNPICNSYGTGTMASAVPTTIVYYINACRGSHSYRSITSYNLMNIIPHQEKPPALTVNNLL